MGWRNLPDDLQESVLDRLVDVCDYIRYSLVCKNWLSTAQFHHNQWQKHHQLPMLLVHKDRSMEFDSHNGRVMDYDSYTLHSIVGKDLTLINKATLHVPHTFFDCCGSSHGWLIFIHDTDTLAFILYNPFTRATIHLPPITKLRTEDEFERQCLFRINVHCIKKIVISEDPSLCPDRYQVLVMFKSFNIILLFRSGSDYWVCLEWPKPYLRTMPPYSDYSDAIYYRGKFYITAKRWFITVESAHSSSPRPVVRQLVPEQESSDFEKHITEQYLAESCSGSLLYIERSSDLREYARGSLTLSELRVYRVNLDHDGPMMRCTRLQSLDGEALFLGFNSSSLSLLASEFSGCQPECIYYNTKCTDIFHRSDTGVYDMVRRQWAKGFDPKIPDRVPQIWIVPKANLNTTLATEIIKKYQQLASQPEAASMDEDEIFHKVIPGSHGRVRCYGLGPTPPSKFRKTSGRIDLVTELCETQKQNELLKSQIDELMKSMEQIKRQQEELMKDKDARLERVEAQNQRPEAVVSNIMCHLGQEQTSKPKKEGGKRGFLDLNVNEVDPSNTVVKDEGYA